MCVMAVILTCMTQNHVGLPLADKTAARFPDLIAYSSWHYEAAVFWQHNMLTTQLKAVLPSGATFVISLWPIWEICTKDEERP